MPHVVTEACIACKYTNCAATCPTQCFHEGPNFVVINPDECIDCGVCEPECPAHAIFPLENVPGGLKEYVDLNARLSKTWPKITDKKDPLPGADAARERKGKRSELAEG